MQTILLIQSKQSHSSLVTIHSYSNSGLVVVAVLFYIIILFIPILVFTVGEGVSERAMYIVENLL